MNKLRKIIPYGHQSIDNADIEEVVKTLKSDFLTQGPKISEFESALASYCEAKYAVVFNSGTSALHGAYFSCGLKEGDEFITSPLTFVATSNAGLFLGAKPVFVDIEKDTGNIDPSKIELAITEKAKMVVPVHYAGMPSDLEKIQNIARKNNIYVVEDACHALGAWYKESNIGSSKYSDMTVLSFHPVKHITTGEGGAVLTNNPDFYNKLLLFRNHGITKNREDFINRSDGDWYYEMQCLGYNYRMTDIQAALGISQLKRLASFVKRRREIAIKYNGAFSGNKYFDIVTEKGDLSSSYHLYPILLKEDFVNKKKMIFTRLREEGIGVQTHYIPICRQPYYQNMGYNCEMYPVARNFYMREISLPIYSSMSDADVECVIETIFSVFEKKI